MQQLRDIAPPFGAFQEAYFVCKWGMTIYGRLHFGKARFLSCWYRVACVVLTLSFLPVSPVISPSFGSTTVDVLTSPLPVASMMSTTLGSPSVVICATTKNTVSRFKTNNQRQRESIQNIYCWIHLVQFCKICFLTLLTTLSPLPVPSMISTIQSCVKSSFNIVLYVLHVSTGCPKKNQNANSALNLKHFANNYAWNSYWYAK